MRKRKGMAIVAAVVMTAVLSAGSSLAATSVGISDGAAAVRVEDTTVGFAGHEWWVIGDANGGVYSKDKSVTLLAKDYDFGDTAFNERDNFGKIPNAYKDSTLQKKMESIADGLAAKERGKINSRTLSASDGIVGDDVANQKVWALSGDEYLSIGEDATISNKVRSYGKDNWLRSYSRDINYYAWFAPAAGPPYIVDSLVYHSMAARPALNLNLTSVIFTSDASVASKSSATPGGGLVSATAPDTTGTNNKIKYTFRDDSLKLGNVYVSKIENNTVTVKYEGATAGKTLSVIVKNNSGVVTHYGKLAEKIKAEGEAGFTLPAGYDSTKDKIELFVEEIGGENSSDFACTPKALDMTVKNIVTVNGGTGGGAYAKDAEVTLTADAPAQGKRFVRWDISPAVTLTQGSLTNETIKFIMPDEPVTATAVYEDIPPVVYPIKDGGSSTWQQGDEGGLIVTSEGEHRKFTGVSVDGAMLDSEHYTAVSGSTVVTLKASYLSTLSVGEHVLRIHFTDGYTETKFSIQEVQTTTVTTAYNPPTTTVQPPNPPVEPGKPNPPVQGGTTTATTVTLNEDVSPKTGDSSLMWLIAIIMLSSGIVFFAVGSVKKSKKSK